MLAVVDVCFPSDARRILELVAGEWHRDPHDVRLIILTHAHLDHVNGADYLASRTNALMAAHSAGRDFLSGAAAIPVASWRKRIEFLRFFFRYGMPRPTLRDAVSMPWSGIPGLKRGLRTRVDLWLEDGQALPGHSGWSVIHTPGHTPDGICLYNEASRSLIAGDTIVDLHGRPVLNRLLELDSRAVTESFGRLRPLPVEALYPGWGSPHFGPDLLGRVAAD
jgi:glyoxylase-like metal-dependent hydrolase (beta-lactamase superfamily II)